MATTTISDTTVVFSNSGAAANLSNSSLTEDSASLALTFDVLALSGGGTKTTLYSVDDGIAGDDNPAVTTNNAFITYDTDLLYKDTAVSSWSLGGDTSANGAHVWIGSDNKVHYDAGNLAATINALHTGEYFTDTFLYTIKMSNGTLSVGTITVKIAGVNDAVTTPIDTNAATNAVNENAAVGTIVGLTAQATDADGDPITYSLVDDAGGKFAIDPNTGVVTVAGAINYETDGPSLNITVRATSADSTADKTFAIVINNLDEIAPTITSGATAAAINENSGAGQAVYTVTSDDTADISAGVTYSLKAVGDFAAFTIDPNTGVVTLTGNPNYEAKSSYSFTVLADDGVNTPTEKAVTLAINDVNEGPTITLDATPVSVPENAAPGVIGDADATDPDLGGGNDGANNFEDLTFSIVSVDGFTSGAVYNLFSINGSTGEISLAGALDYETDQSYSIVVRVTDGPGLFDQTTLTVNVTDVAENAAPVAEDDVWVLSDTAIPAGTITPLWFTNNDTDANLDPLFVTAVSGLTGSGLTANFVSGTLTSITGTAVAGTYNLTYTLSDGTLTDSGAVTLTVIDTISNADTITLTNNDFSYIDGQSGGDTITGPGIVVDGNAGIDTFVGNNGNDVLSGGAGNDKLSGNENGDTLTGGAGADLLTGGNGNDFFRFSLTTEGIDTITDFSNSGGGNDDAFQLAAAGFGAIGAALDAAEFLSAAGATAATTAAHRIIYNTTTGDLYYDADGTGGTAAVQIAVLGGAPTLTIADFVIV
jgi:VCBS repeat-containing protein